MMGLKLGSVLKGLCMGGYFAFPTTGGLIRGRKALIGPKAHDPSNVIVGRTEQPDVVFGKTVQFEVLEIFAEFFVSPLHANGIKDIASFPTPEGERKGQPICIQIHLMGG